MLIRAMTTLVLGLLVAFNAQAYLKVLEEAIEATTREIRLPERGSSNTIVVRQCPGCTPLLLRLHEGTKYYIDKREVPYEELRALARKVEAGLYVFYDPENEHITRMVLSP